MIDVWRRLHSSSRDTATESGDSYTKAFDAIALGARGRDYDKGKNVNRRKRHILGNIRGLLLGVAVTSAARSDAAGAPRLCARLGGADTTLRRIGGDDPSRGRLVVRGRLHCRCILQPVVRCDDRKGVVVLPRRWVVERSFA